MDDTLGELGLNPLVKRVSCFHKVGVIDNFRFPDQSIWKFPRIGGLQYRIRNISKP